LYYETKLINIFEAHEYGSNKLHKKPTRKLVTLYAEYDLNKCVMNKAWGILSKSKQTT